MKNRNILLFSLLLLLVAAVAYASDQDQNIQGNQMMREEQNGLGPNGMNGPDGQNGAGMMGQQDNPGRETTTQDGMMQGFGRMNMTELKNSCSGLNVNDSCVISSDNSNITGKCEYDRNSTLICMQEMRRLNGSRMMYGRNASESNSSRNQERFQNSMMGQGVGMMNESSSIEACSDHSVNETCTIQMNNKNMTGKCIYGRNETLVCRSVGTPDRYGNGFNGKNISSDGKSPVNYKNTRNDSSDSTAQPEQKKGFFANLFGKIFGWFGHK